MRHRRCGPYVLLLLLFSLFVSAAGAQAPHTHQHRFEDAERWARVFDDPKRDVWQQPDEVIRTLKLQPDAIVADIGAGTGYFAVRLARAVPDGRVYAVDLEPDMVTHLEKRAKHEALANIRAVEAAPDDARLPEPVDLVLMVNTYHHVEEREDYFRALAQSLKPSGRLAIIDFRKDSRFGPPRSTRIELDQVVAELKQAGYAVSEQYDFLSNQYFVIFEFAGARQ